VKVVTIAAAKGGSCKSTVCLSIAVGAVQEGLRVALFDLNADQGDLTKW
jgi:cellulose biosynthesis protein BcsQ